MKQLFFLAFAAFICSLSSCSSKKKEEAPMSKIGLMLQGEHKLRKLAESNGSNASMNGSFFIFGSISTEVTSGPIVSFAWEKDSSTYILSTLPFNKIRIKFVDKIDAPIIKFRWSSSGCGCDVADDIDKIMREDIIYAVISIKKEDWPQEIHLPMNKTN